jgi:hypothetical protein
VVFAQGLDELNDVQSDATHRIENAAMLSTLTMRATALSCALNSGFDTEKYISSLTQTKRDFIQILSGLKEGDETLNLIGAESAAPILELLGFIEDNWPVFDRALETASDVSVERIHFMDHALEGFTNRTFLYSELLSAEVVGDYADPFVLTFADAFMVSLAARQGTISQRLFYKACYAWSDFHPNDARESLATDIEIFERSLTAMRDGMADMGIQPAPTPEIASKVEEVTAAWEAVRDSLNALAQDDTLTDVDKATLLSGLDAIPGIIGELTDSYSIYATRHHSK